MDVTRDVSRHLPGRSRGLLEKYYEDELPKAGPDRPEEERALWTSTPQQYLEKIFQIPFTLARLTPDGHEALVRHLMRPEPPPSATEEIPREPEPAPETSDAATKKSEPPDQEAPSEVEETTQQNLVDGEKPSAPAAEVDSQAKQRTSEASEQDGEDGPGDADEKAARDEPKAQGETEQQDEPIDVRPRALKIGEDEIKSLARLGPLIATPRSTKRLVNFYRLFRASLDEEKLDDFEKGEYEVVQLLLAIQIGFPSLAADVYRAVKNTEARSFKDFVTGLKPAVKAAAEKDEPAEDKEPTRADAYSRQRLHKALRTIEIRSGAEDWRRPFLDWIPHVARFSFQTGRIIGSMSFDQSSSHPAEG